MEMPSELRAPLLNGSPPSSEGGEGEGGEGEEEEGSRSSGETEGAGGEAFTSYPPSPSQGGDMSRPTTSAVPPRSCDPPPPPSQGNSPIDAGGKDSLAAFSR
jgi:hypothetical protein